MEGRENALIPPSENNIRCAVKDEAPSQLRPSKLNACPRHNDCADPLKEKRFAEFIPIIYRLLSSELSRPETAVITEYTYTPAR
jgi:hypothetical protein